MVRLFYLSGLILFFCLTCISNVMSDGLNPSTQSPEIHQRRAVSHARSEFSQQSQGNLKRRVQSQVGNIQPVSSQYVQRTAQTNSENRNRAINQIEAKTNPITPVDRQQQNKSGKANNQAARRSPSIWGTLGALLVVISIILVSAKLFKKHHPMAATNLPGEVVEVLGKKPLDARQSIHFIRCGSRILILGSSPAGLEMLSEVLDPVEVDLITGMCRERSQTGTGMMNTTFKSLFQSSQKKSDQAAPSQEVNQFRQMTNTEQKPSSSVSEQEDYSDYDSAVTRLQQKLIHSSRQSFSENAESEHA